MSHVVGTDDRIHVITRRLFEDDLRRHFVGVVRECVGNVVRAEGYVFVFHPGRNEYERRPARRERIITLSDAGNIVNVLPRAVEIDDVHYRMENQRLVVTDGKGLSLDINEFGPVA